MKGRTLWSVGITAIAAMVVAVFIAGCGGGKAPRTASGGSSINSGLMGEMVLTIDWGKSRVIPPSTVKVDVTITGDGLVNPFQDSIPRPQNQQVVSKVYQLPVGFKWVLAEAKDSNNRTVASGTGTTTLTEGQRSNLEIVMSEITVRMVLVRTFRGNQQSPPDFIAYQDGSGAWQIPQGSGGQYTLTINDPNGRYGLVIVNLIPLDSEARVNIIHATVSELSEINFVSEVPPSANRVTVSGMVSGLGSNEWAEIAMGDARTSASPPPYNTYSLEVPPGTYDLIATKNSWVNGLQINKVFIQRDISVSGNTNIPIDFSSPNAFDPETHNAVISGALLSGETAGSDVHFRSHNGTEIFTGGKFEAPPPFQFSFAGIPISKQFGNDIHLLRATAFSETASRLIERYFKTPTDISITFPSPFGNAQVTVAATTPYTRLTAIWDAYSGAQAYFAEFGQFREVGAAPRCLSSNPIPSRQRKRPRQPIASSWFVGLSAGWLGGQSSYTLPDFSDLSGWNNSWGLPTSGTVGWEVGAVATNRPIQDFVNAERTPVDGLEARMAAKRGTVTITP